MKAPDQYSESVFEFLEKAEPGKSFLIKNLTRESSRTQFMDAVKLYIRTHDYGGGWEFNTDYTKIRKHEIPPEALANTKHLNP